MSEKKRGSGIPTIVGKSVLAPFSNRNWRMEDDSSRQEQSSGVRWSQNAYG